MVRRTTVLIFVIFFQTTASDPRTVHTQKHNIHTVAKARRRMPIIIAPELYHAPKKNHSRNTILSRWSPPPARWTMIREVHTFHRRSAAITSTYNTRHRCLPHLTTNSDSQLARFIFQSNTPSQDYKKALTFASIDVGNYLRHKINETKKGSPWHLTQNTERQYRCVYASIEIIFVCTLYIYNVNRITSKYTSYTRQRKLAS